MRTLFDVDVVGGWYSESIVLGFLALLTAKWVGVLKANLLPLSESWALRSCEMQDGCQCW